MDNTIKTNYKGTEIQYDEFKDRWTFELDGKERFAATLTNAKAAVDSPERKTKAPFEKFDAYHVGRWETAAKRVTITSFVVENFRSTEAWVVSGGKRQKVDLSDLYVISPENDQRMAELRALKQERETLDKKSEHKRKELKNVEAPKGE